MIGYGRRVLICLLLCGCLLRPIALAAPSESDGAAVLVVDLTLAPVELAELTEALTGEGGLLNAFAAGGGAKRRLALVVFGRDARALPLGEDGFWADVGSDPGALAAVKASLLELSSGEGSNLEGALAVTGNLFADSGLGAPISDITSRSVLLFSPATPNRFPPEPVPGDTAAAAGTGDSAEADYPSCQNVPGLARRLRDSGAQLLAVGYGDLDENRVVTATAARACAAEGWHRHDPAEDYGEGVRGRLTGEGFSLHLREDGMPANGHRVNACGNGCATNYFQGPHQVLEYTFPTARQWLTDDLAVDALYAPGELTLIAGHFPPPAAQSAQVVVRHVYHTFLTGVDESGQEYHSREVTFTEEDAPRTEAAGTSLRIRPRPPLEDSAPTHGPFRYGLDAEAVDMAEAPEQALTLIPGDNALTLHYSRFVDLREAASVRVIHSYAVLDARPGQNESRTWQEGAGDAPLTGWYAGQIYHTPYRLPEGFSSAHVLDPAPHEEGVRLLPGLNVISLSYERRVDAAPAPVPTPPAPGGDPEREEPRPAPQPSAPPSSGQSGISQPVAAFLTQLLQAEDWRDVWASLAQIPLLQLLFPLRP